MKLLRPLRLLAAALQLLFSWACGSASIRPGEPDGGAAQAKVLFRVHAPATTPAGASIYITGSFQGWNPMSAAHKLTEVGALTYELELSFDLGTDLEFKFTRGSLESVEKSATGEDIASRTFEVIAPTTLDLTIGSWADISPSTIAGDVTTISVPRFLGGRRVWVYLPPGYHASSARYPVLYMLDGQNVFDRVTSFAGEWRVDETLEALIPAGTVAPLIVVAIDNNGAGRIAEYTPWRSGGSGGDGAAHLAAIADVLVPHIDATYRTRTGPAHTGIGGSSLGGLMALYATEARPDVFGRNAAMSPSVWWADKMIVTFASQSPRPAGARLWMDMGTAESQAAIPDMRAMRDALLGQGFTEGVDLKVVEDPGAGHNEAAWSRRFPDAVRFLFPP